MKLIFFNRFFYPDNSATSQILTDLAFHLAERGHEVHVVTSRPESANGHVENVRGIFVHSAARARSGPQTILQKARAYATYYLGARRVAADLVSAGDIAIVMTDPPMLASAIESVASNRGAALVNWLQDVFPEIAQTFGIPGTSGLTGIWLRKARDRSLKRASTTVAIADSMAKRLLTSRIVTEGQVHVIHNWANGKLIQPSAPDDNVLRREWHLQDRFVVGYSGNLGRVHEFETLLGAAEILRHDANISFLIIGRGPRLGEVIQYVSSRGLENVCFRPHQELNMLSQSLGVANVHLCVLHPTFEGLVHPSKLYGTMAAGRPTIFVGDDHGETAAILRDSSAGISIRTGEATQLANAIVSLRNDPKRCEAMGRAARQAFTSKYDMPIALKKWEHLLELLAHELSEKAGNIIPHV
jgi:colanic acid biosynthesis glycosyl transferase WcaI